MEILKPIQSVEQEREMGSKGGNASGRARREKKTMKAMLDYLLEKKVTSKDGKKATSLEAMMSSSVAKANKGEVRAAQFVRDTIGEVPTQTVNNNNTNANFNIDDASVINEVLNKLKEL